MRELHLSPAAAICACAAFTAAALASTDDPTNVGALLAARLAAKASHQPASARRPSSLTRNSVAAPRDSMRAV
ncbi:hypothetical protein [Mycobacterium sp. 852002-51057_SCH5723018]|uniref:hypothetical protein n=1 Tax=Mycobacterium sp. 852002-51057_SCH5723018 TaxID=1834094 RepID=UPI0012E81412|nr:hypothetical protein [Mycobacterium sp. 852002-51057_SCH5723018]